MADAFPYEVNVDQTPLGDHANVEAGLAAARSKIREMHGYDRQAHVQVHRRTPDGGAVKVHDSYHPVDTPPDPGANIFMGIYRR